MTTTTVQEQQGIARTSRQPADMMDADTFHLRVWGAEDLHVGIYESAYEDVFEASRRTVERMASYVDEQLHDGARVLDLGAGYGGAARWLARQRHCHVSCLHESEVQSRQSRKLTRAEGLEDHVEVLAGGIDDVPAADERFEVVWSQDAIVRSDDKARVFEEIDRVLKPGGLFVMTDPMEPELSGGELLERVIERTDVDEMGSFEFYARLASAHGWETVERLDLTPHLVRHHRRMLEELDERHDELVASVGRAAIEQVKEALDAWVCGGERGHLAWGILVFEKPALASDR